MLFQWPSSALDLLPYAGVLIDRKLALLSLHNVPAFFKLQLYDLTLQTRNATVIPMPCQRCRS